MSDLAIPYAVMMSPPGVYPGVGGLSVDDWCEQYLDTGQHLVDWETCVAQQQRDLVTWEQIQIFGGQS